MALNRFYLTENSIAQRSGLCIFISHQKRDADTAKKIADYFITSGIDVYFDEYDTKIDRTRPYSVVSAIKTGIRNSPATSTSLVTSVVSAIKTGIRNSTHMLCLLSQNALDSKWIPWEVGYGYDRTTVVGLTLKEISQSVLPEYLQIVPILRGTKSLNNFISNVLKRDESTLINERKLFAAYQSQHPLDSVLNWEL